MGAPTAIFVLMLVTYAGDTFSLTKIKEFPSEEACTKVATAVEVAVGKVKDVQIGCVSGKSLSDLKAADR
jgi:hypothetical protein